ncbi:MAG: S9 family peptidase [Burkholderiales bacterium]|nr:S9 family peptidase [Burkholderiales bacterium]
MSRLESGSRVKALRRWSLLVLVCGGLGAAALAQAAGPRIPIADFVRPAQFASPVLSPDAKYLIIKARTEQEGRDTWRMMVYDLTNSSIVANVRMPVFEVPVRYWWISNTRLAVTTGREFGSLEGPQWTGEVLTMDFDGRNQEYVYGYHMYTRSRKGTTIGDDYGTGTIAQIPLELSGRFFLNENLWSQTSERSRLYDIDGKNATRKLVTEIPKRDFQFMLQNDGKPRFAFGSDDEYFESIYRFDDARSEWLPMAGSERSNLRPLAILPDNKDFYATFGLKGGPRSLVRQSLASGERTELAVDKIGDIDRIEWSPRPSVPFAAGTNVGKPKLTYFDDKRPEAQLHKLLAAQFPGDDVIFSSFSADGAKLVFWVGSDRDPGSYYLFDRASGKAVLLFTAREWIDPARMAERRPIKFKASDGLELHGYLTLPVERDDSKLPLVLLPHGGPHTVADEWYFDPDAQFLASRGYAVLQVNFRGSGGRGTAFEASGFKQWGGRVQQDLIDGVRWLVEQGTVDAARICSYGGSFGAYSAMMTSVRAPGLFKCAVGYAGLYDLPLWYESDEVRKDRKFYNYLVRVIGTDKAVLEQNSPSKLADKLTIPVLLVHGEEDRRTQPDQAEAMRAALIKAGRPPEWMMVPNEGHGFFAGKNRQAFYEKLEAFLTKHIGK